MNLIEQLGGYEATKEKYQALSCVKSSPCGVDVIAHILKQAFTKEV